MFFSSLLEIERLLRQRLPVAEFEQRRIVCGNAAHFQGDERDVMFLSMVDVPEGGHCHFARTIGSSSATT